MIHAKRLDTGETVYSEARDIETHDLQIDNKGFITFYDSRFHKKCITEMPWKNGVQDFIDFVEHEVNTEETDTEFPQ